MTINEFVNGFNSASDKEKYVKKHIIRTYVPYEEKVAKCQRIIDNSMYVIDDDKLKFKPNTPLLRELFIITATQSYTDIEYDTGEALNGFNALAEIEADSYIMEAVNTDVTVFKSVLDMMIDDTYDLERNIVDYINKKIDILIDLISTISNVEQGNSDE